MPPRRRRLSTHPDPGKIDRLIERLERLRASLLEAETRVRIPAFGASHQSARNLVHYLALRRYDLRRIQEELVSLGLSSLGRAEGHVLDNLSQVLACLGAMSGRGPRQGPGPPSLSPTEARSTLERNAVRLFGPARPGRATRIMVTAPSEAAYDPVLVSDLLSSGMDCLRINCAHDSEADRRRMVELLHRAERGGRRRCRVEMDLGGPRLRTGPLEPGPAVIKVRPDRDEFGHVRRMARLWLVSTPSHGPESEAGEGEAVVPADWLARRHVGEIVRLRDARRARRNLRLVARIEGGWAASVSKTVYLTNGLSLVAGSDGRRADRCTVGGVPARPGRLRLTVGSRLWLSASVEARHPRRSTQRQSPVPVIGVSVPSVIRNVRPGHHVSFDGGRMGGVVRSVSPSGALVEVTSTPAGGAWLRGDQGINLQDTDLGLPSLTDQDLADLSFVVRYADLVGYSFVQSGADVSRLREELRRLGRPRMGIVLKIETRRAFEQLPEILLAALAEGPCAVMLARGDLAVEVGFERLAEVQEEMLWLCEAAHLPTVWATQVLEGLAKSGIPSRADVTDAAMGERAECVMLNKGPYLVPAVRVLDSIVRRMLAHQDKKSARLRHLAVAERFLRSRGDPDSLLLAGAPARPS